MNASIITTTPLEWVVFLIVVFTLISIAYFIIDSVADKIALPEELDEVRKPVKKNPCRTCPMFNCYVEKTSTGPVAWFACSKQRRRSRGFRVFEYGKCPLNKNQEETK